MIDATYGPIWPKTPRARTAPCSTRDSQNGTAGHVVRTNPDVSLECDDA
jgi:hypothetical protein